MKLIEEIRERQAEAMRVAPQAAWLPRPYKDIAHLLFIIDAQAEVIGAQETHAINRQNMLSMPSVEAHQRVNESRRVLEAKQSALSALLEKEIG